MASRSVQRARKPNYTQEETETLLNQLILYGHFLFNKNQPVNNQQKADVWANIAMQVNAVPNSAGRTIDELKHRWQDMAQRARHALRKTPFKPIPFLNKILQILGDSNTRDGKNHHQDETSNLVTSMDSTHSSDSSFVVNVKDELINADQNTTAVDLSQSNGTSRSNMKRLHPGNSNSTKFTSQASLPGETEKMDNNSSSTSMSLTPNIHIPTSAVSKKNGNDDGDAGAHHDERFESKRRRMKKSSNPRKSVSSISYHDQDYNASYDDDQNDADHDEGLTIQHKHIETFRSMVLDPDSEIVMEVEGSANVDRGATEYGDIDSSNSSISGSNLSTTHNNHLDVNNGLADKTASVYFGSQCQQLQMEEEETEGGPYQPSPVTSHVPNIRQSGHRNNKPSSLPLFLVNNRNKNKSNKNFSPYLRSNQSRRGSQRTPHDNVRNSIHQQQPQQQREQLEDLDSKSKADLDRRCVISQIQMQEQRTRYLLLKEQKIQLEIEILKGKCSCQNPLNTNTSNKMTNSSPHGLVMPTSSSSFLETNSHVTNAFPVSPCHLSISSVASFKTNAIVNHELEVENSIPKVKGDGKNNTGEDEGSLAEKDDSNSTPNLENENSKNNSESDDNGDVDNNDNNDDVGAEEDVSMMVSFGDDNDNDKDCNNAQNVNGVQEDVYGSEPKTGDDWEKTLQENIGL